MKNPSGQATKMTRFLLIMISIWTATELISLVDTVKGEDTYRPPYDSRALSDNQKIESGKKEMDSLVKRSKLPKSGECWKEALENLRVSCSELTEDLQSRLALSFTSCYNELIGSQNHICDRSTPVKTCLGVLDQAEKDIFRDYFLHTQDMCYFIQSELWHEETDRAVNDLQAAAYEMGQTVMEQKSVAESILESQRTSHNVQKEMIQENYELFEKVKNIKSSIEEFGVNANEHRIIFIEIFEKLRKMHELVLWIQGEMSLLDFAAFYLAVFFFAYFVTAHERTCKARVWMFLNLGLSVFLERYIYGVLAERGDLTPDEILMYIFYLRRGMGAVTMGIFFIHVAKYRDYETINNTLLMDMGKRMDLMMEYWQEHVKSLQQLQLQQTQAGLRAVLNVVPAEPPVAPVNEEDPDEDSDSTTTDSDDDGEVADTESASDEEEINAPAAGGAQNLSAPRGVKNVIPPGDPAQNGLESDLESGAEDEDDERDEDGGAENGVEQPAGASGTLFQRFNNLRFTAKVPTVQVVDYNALPENDAATGSHESAVSPKYNLRDRATISSPSKLSDFMGPGGKEKRGKNAKKSKSTRRRGTAGYFSSDDEMC